MRLLLLACSCTLAAYAVINLAVSAWLLLHWRMRRSSWIGRSAALQLFRRCLPAILSAGLSALIVLPSFLAHEPRDRVEPVSLPLALGAAAGLGLLLAALARGLAALTHTRGTVRAWMAGATPVVLAHWPGQAWVVESDAVGVCFVGLLRRKLLVSRAVLAACTRRELDGIVAHERAHAARHDNWKKLLVACLPDVVGLTPAARSMERVREARAEEEADAHALANDPAAGAELAGALVKLARHGTEVRLGVATSFHACGPIERRIRSLLRGGLRDGGPPPAWGPLSSAMLAAATACAAFPALSQRVHLATEALVRLLSP